MSLVVFAISSSESRTCWGGVSSRSMYSMLMITGARPCPSASMAHALES